MPATAKVLPQTHKSVSLCRHQHTLNADATTSVLPRGGDAAVGRERDVGAPGFSLYLPFESFPNWSPYVTGSRCAVIRKPAEMVFDTQEEGEMVFQLSREVSRPSCPWIRLRAPRAFFAKNQPHSGGPSLRTYWDEVLLRSEPVPQDMATNHHKPGA